MKFATLITCMDGRIQRPLNDYVREYFDAPNIDTLAWPGACGPISRLQNPRVIEYVDRGLDISFNLHASCGMAIAGHHDCAGNPVNKAQQCTEVELIVQRFRESYGEDKVIGLWVNDQWTVERIC